MSDEDLILLTAELDREREAMIRSLRGGLRGDYSLHQAESPTAGTYGDDLDEIGRDVADQYGAEYEGMSKTGADKFAIYAIGGRKYRIVIDSPIEMKKELAQLLKRHGFRGRAS